MVGLGGGGGGLGGGGWGEDKHQNKSSTVTSACCVYVVIVFATLLAVLRNIESPKPTSRLFATFGERRAHLCVSTCVYAARM